MARGVEVGRHAAGGVEKRLRLLGDRLRLGGAPKRIGDQLRDSYETGWREAPCTFVCSTGRTGTVTLTQLLALSPQVHAVHEPIPRLIHASHEAFVDRCASPYWSTVVLAARDDILCDVHRRGLIYVETSNRLTFLAPALASTFPASRFVFLHRHPYEYVRSAVRRRYYDGHHWDFARPTPRPDDPMAGAWHELSAAERSAWLWATVNAEIAAFVASLPPERVLTLGSDALFAGDPADVEAIFGLVGASPPAAAAVRKVLDRPLNAQSTGEFDLDVSTKRLVDKLVGPMAETLGHVLR